MTVAMKENLEAGAAITTLAIPCWRREMDHNFVNPFS